MPFLLLLIRRPSPPTSGHDTSGTPSPAVVGNDTVLGRNPSPNVLQWMRRLLVLLDVLVATIAIYLSGGPLSPMFIVYSLTIPVSIILLDPRGVYRSTGLAVFMYSVLAFLEGNRLIPNVDAYWSGPDLTSQATPITYALYVNKVG